MTMILESEVQREFTRREIKRELERQRKIYARQMAAEIRMKYWSSVVK